MNICKRQFRIVTDRFAGYEIQVRRWYWPFWQQADICNTHKDVEQAKEFIVKIKKIEDFRSKEVERWI